MKILLIDGLNALFIRNYIANPSLSLNGAPIGGVFGAFKSLQKLCNEIKPDKIIICWDGGSRKRKQQNSNYKKGRKPLHLNRSTKVMSETEELENKIWQQTRLFECLNCLPVIQFMFDDIEADDIIAYLCKYFKNENKIIVSSDKDFLQLCFDNKTVLYRPIQKEILTKKNIPEIYGIHPNNMCLARAISGDKSDNLLGVKGIALKGLAQRLVFLKEEKTYSIEEIIKYCKEQSEESKIKFWSKIFDAEDVIKSNYKIMQLAVPSISFDVKQKIDYVLENIKFEFNKTKLITLMIKDGWGVYNFNPLYCRMNKIMKDLN